VTAWKLDNKGKYFGFITPTLGASVFLHSAMVIHGTPSVGARVSFRSEASPKNPDQQQAYDAVVLAAGEHVGTVVKWGMKDKNGMPFGFVSVDGCDASNGAYLATNDILSGDPVQGADVIHLLQDSSVRPGTKQAKQARIVASGRN
jgi:cold shock CspA family protein